MDSLGFIVVLAGVLLISQLPAASAQSDFVSVTTACNTTAQNGTISLPADLTPGQCIITVSRNVSVDPKYTTLHLNSINLKSLDYLLIYDGDHSVADNLVSNVSGMADPFTVVASSASTYLIIQVTTVNSSSILDATYDTKVCEMMQSVSSPTIVSSPMYLQNKFDFTCDYIFTKTGDNSTMLALSFAQVSLTNATLNITSDQGLTTVSGNALPRDVYGASSLKMTLTVKTANVSDSFSAGLYPIAASPECGQVVEVNGSKTISLSVADQSMAYDCRMTLKASSGQSLLLNVTSLQLLRGDSLVLIDGPSLAGQHQLASFSESASEHLILSGEQQVLLRLLFGGLIGSRSLTIDVNELATVNHLYNSGTFVLTPSSGNVAVPQYYLLETDIGSVVELNLQAEQANKTYSYTVSVYDGSDMFAHLMVTFSNAKRVPVPTSDHTAFVVATLSNTSQPLNMTFTSKMPGCDAVTMSRGESVTLDKDSSVPAKCLWTIAAKADSTATILLDFPQVELEKNATLSAFSGVSGAGAMVAQLTAGNLQASRPLPTVAVPASQWAQVVFSSGNSTNLTSVAIDARFHVVDTLCGGDIKDNYGRIQTPGFPNRYPINAVCTWTFPLSNKTQVLFFDFAHFSLAQKHSLTITEQLNGTERTVGTFSGTLDLADLIYTTNTTNKVVFSAQPEAGAVLSNQVDEGIDLQYWVLECGGSNNLSSGSFSTPGFPALTNGSLCVWSISLKATTDKSVNIVNMTLHLKRKGSPSVKDAIKVYDGNNLRKPLAALNTSQGDTINVLSRYNVVVIVFNTTNMTSANALGLLVRYTTYSCDKDHQCRNGICMHPDWVCNGIDDCGDNSDEQHCVGPPAPVNPPKKGMKAGIVVLLFFVGFLLGVVLAFVVPRLIRRFRSNRYTAFHNDPVA